MFLYGRSVSLLWDLFRNTCQICVPQIYVPLWPFCLTSLSSMLTFPCVWACKLRTVLEATWECGCGCRALFTNTQIQIWIIQKGWDERVLFGSKLTGTSICTHMQVGEICWKPAQQPERGTAWKLESAQSKKKQCRVYLLAGEGVLYPLIGRPGRAGGDRLPSMWGKK